MLKKVTYLLLILLFSLSGLTAADYEQKIDRSFQLSAGGAIELANVNGEITISTAGGTAVAVKAVKSSDDKGEIENVDVVFETGKDTLKVYVKYNKKNARAKVDFTVSIPEKLARAQFKSINGKIDCSGKFADLTLNTVNGKIAFSGGFRNAVLETVNGAIDLSQDPLLSGDLKAETVNGAIAIELNRKSAFELAGQTINGSIDNDFGLQVERHLVGKSLNGKVNGGGFKVKVETVNGSIDISKI
ncbi:MAG TPA: DUF4097 family beta strand repeat-containing protein [Acidobacteriota bacterium]